MKQILSRNMLLALAVFALFFVAGCQSQQAGDKSGDDMNPKMSAQQKAAIAEHKKKADLE